MSPSAPPYGTDTDEGWLNDRRRAFLQYGLGYAGVTVAPLVVLAAVEPTYGTVALGAAALLAGLYTGMFGDDVRAESVRASAYVGPSDPEAHEVPSSKLSSRAIVAYTTGVAALAFVSFVVAVRLWL